jgi:hypothetical protein
MRKQSLRLSPMILKIAKRLRHKQLPASISEILFIPLPFCTQFSRRNECFLLPVFFLQNSFSNNKLKLIKYEAHHSPLISHGAELGDTTEEKKQPK